MAHILIVDDERELCAVIAALFSQQGHTTQCVCSGEAALHAANDRRPDLVLLDLRLGGMDGLETLRRLKPIAPGSPIVMMTAFGNVQAAVNAMKIGATDFVSKPFNNQALLSTIEALLATGREARDGAPMLVGESPPFRKAMDLALKFAVPDINILLLGETGTGKELFARTIHAASKRREGPFVPVDCSMLAENLIESELFGHEKGAYTGATSTRIGRFEMAQRGTIFLDEIGNLPAGFQAKLLRVLQERCMERVGGQETIQLDVRVVSATNVNLKDAICAGKFRQDLYYRLQEMTICLPSLRQRNGDLRRIAQYFVTLYAGRFGNSVRGISDGAFEILESYDWPGNVRELENAMKSAVVQATDVVLAEHLPAEIRDHTVPTTTTTITTHRLARGFPDVCSLPSNGSEDDPWKSEIEFGCHLSEIDLKAYAAEAGEQAERALLTALLCRGRMSGAQMAKMLSVDPKTLRTKLKKYGLEMNLPRPNEKLAAGRILVVDDQEDMCWVLSKLLSKRGHAVNTAPNGARALKMLDDFDCQVAVVDYRLPDSNGIALSVQMRLRLPRLSSILMTSYGGEALCQQAMDEHLFAYFDKPFNNDIMISTIEAALQACEATGEDGSRARAQTLFPGRPHAGVRV